jgi:hypothetical protein
MKRTRLWIAALPLVTIGVSACGSGGDQVPNVAGLPLVKGARVVAQAKQCDPGANAFCAVEMVVVDPTFGTSEKLVKGEQLHLLAAGWTRVNGDTGDEVAAQSPGHKLRVTYATASRDLRGIDLGWIKRSRPITLALSRALFDRDSAMSVMLELGSS